MSALIWRTAGRVVLNECSTHFGLPVVPDVKAMRKISSALMCTRCSGGERGGRGDALLEIPLAVHRLAGDDHVGEARNALAQLTRHGHVVEAPEGGGADERATAGEAQDVVELAHPEVGVDLVGDRSDQLEREEHNGKGDAVRELDGDDVAALDADLAQECRAALHLVLQRAVGDAALRIGEHLPVGMRLGPGTQNVEERLAGPNALPCASGRQGPAG